MTRPRAIRYARSRWQALGRYIDDGRLDPRFVQLMERLSAKNGWFVPVGTLLDASAVHPGRTGRTHLRLLAARGERPRPPTSIAPM